MPGNQGTEAVEEADPPLEAEATPSEFDLTAYLRSREQQLSCQWLAAAAGDQEGGGDAAAVFGALVDALEPNGGWWLDVTVETLVEAGVRTGDVTHQLERLTDLITSLIRTERGEPTADAAATQLARAAEDLVAACGRRAGAS